MTWAEDSEADSSDSLAAVLLPSVSEAVKEVVSVAAAEEVSALVVVVSPCLQEERRKIAESRAAPPFCPNDDLFIMSSPITYLICAFCHASHVQPDYTLPMIKKFCVTDVSCAKSTCPIKKAPFIETAPISESFSLYSGLSLFP